MGPDAANWLPTIITSALITIAILLFVWKVKRMDEKYMTKEQHELLCKNTHLEFQNHISEQMRILKEEYLEKKFRELSETIKENGKD